MDLTWCLSRLTPHQYVIYLACREIGEAELTIAAIAEKVCMSYDTTRHHLSGLQKLGFIRYDNTNGQGIAVLWIRRTQLEKAPSLSGLQKGRMSVTLISPEGKKFTVKRGNLREFCRQKNLNRRSIYDVLEGKRTNYKKWRED